MIESPGAIDSIGHDSVNKFLELCTEGTLRPLRLAEESVTCCLSSAATPPTNLEHIRGGIAEQSFFDTPWAMGPMRALLGPKIAGANLRESVVSAIFKIVWISVAVPPPSQLRSSTALLSRHGDGGDDGDDVSYPARKNQKLVLRAFDWVISELR
jgi:hypothetical protein